MQLVALSYCIDSTRSCPVVDLLFYIQLWCYIGGCFITFCLLFASSFGSSCTLAVCGEVQNCETVKSCQVTENLNGLLNTVLFWADTWLCLRPFRTTYFTVFCYILCFFSLIMNTRVQIPTLCSLYKLLLRPEKDQRFELNFMIHVPLKALCHLSLSISIRIHF